MPAISIFPDKLPLLPIFIISPSLVGLVGSPTIQKSIFSFFVPMSQEMLNFKFREFSGLKLKTFISGEIRASNLEIRNQGEKLIPKIVLRTGPAGNIAPGNFQAGPVTIAPAGNHSPDKHPIRFRNSF